MSDDGPAQRGLLPGAAPPDPRPERWVIYLDLDAFYVECELKDRPELRGRPVIVGPPPTGPPTRGVVLSASYEARAFGVHSAQPVAAAARLCPTATWIAPDFRKYETESRAVRALLRRFAPDVVPYSIDEAAILVDAGSAASARAAAIRLQQELKTARGLPASLGVATTRVVAKIATDRAKPGGIVVVPPASVAEFLAPLPVRAIPGVGPKTDALLAAHGVRTIGELAGHRIGEVTGWLGGFGRELVRLARGAPEEGPVSDDGPRSRSTDRTLAADATSWEQIEPVLRELARDLARSLAEEGTRYGAVGVALRWGDFTRAQRIRSLPAAQEGPDALAERAVHLGRELWDAERLGRGRPVRTISVRTERLSGRGLRQVSLDDFPTGPSARS